jgi:hypothetical protein
MTTPDPRSVCTHRKFKQDGVTYTTELLNGCSTHYFHATERAVFRWDQYHDLHAGHCVTPVRDVNDLNDTNIWGD